MKRVAAFALLAVALPPAPLRGRRFAARGLTRKTRIAAAISVLLVAVALVAAALVATGPPRVPLARLPSDADHVTLYENGLAAISLHRHFNASDGGDATLTLPLPPTTIFESLTVEGEGITVKELRSALAETSGIHAGDTIAVHVDGGETYRGVVQAIDGEQVALQTDAGITYVKLAKATAIDVAARPAAEPTTPGSLDASILVRATPGEHDVTVTYLAQGPGWTPSYRLDEDSGALTYFATMTGLDDWRGITLDLVSGAPHVAYSPRPYPIAIPQAAKTMAAGMAADVSFDSSFSPSTPMGELHRYHYAGSLDVARGEAVRLVLAQGKATILRHYLDVAAVTGCCWNVADKQDVPVLEKLQIRNDLSEPLAPGTVRVYKDGEWVGEDMLAASVARGEETNVTIAESDEVKARLVLTKHDASASSDDWTYTLTVADHKPTSVDLRVSLEAPSYRTTLHAHAPEGGRVEGTRVVWDATQLAAGASETWTLDYETLKY